MNDHDDPFGLARERKITQSGVRRVFTPHQPIQEQSLFFGRAEQVRKLIENINTPRQHAILYGERGVGKSSLARVAAELVLKQLVAGKLYVKRCDSEDTFETIVADPLDDVGFFDQPLEHFESKREGGDAALGLWGVKAGVHTTSEKGSKTIARRINIQPSTAAAKINGTPGLLLIDEADAIRDPSDKRKLAEFIKQLSDSASPFKVLVVGIAQVAADLTGAHPSVQRCLKETRLGRMADDEITAIVVEGAKRLAIEFDQAAVERIVKLSSGYPHFAHLLSLKCAEDAVAAGRKVVSKEDLREAIGHAVGDAEGSLRNTYDQATRSADTEMYRVTVLAAALLERDEFTAAELRQSIEERVTHQAIEQNALNNYLNRLVSQVPGEAILHRLAKGVYRFSDPRMPSYVKIANGAME